MRVVLDTNVVVSALLFERGRLAWLRDLWQAGRIVPLCSRATIRELIRVLAYPKFDLVKEEIEAVVAAYLPFAEAVTSGRRPDGLPHCRDRYDDEFVTLAAVGGAEVLVSGDAALRALSGKTPFAIESPEQFRRRFA